METICNLTADLQIPRAGYPRHFSLRSALVMLKFAASSWSPLLLGLHIIATMGLLTSSPTQNAPPPPAPSSDGAYIAPDRSARQHCWDARDNFFSCLDRNGIVNSIEEKDKVEKVCGAENQRLEGECAKSWVCCFLEFGFWWIKSLE